MLDLEFLKSPVPFSDVLIYRYSSGVLRGQLRDCIERVTKATHGMLLAYDSADLFTRWTTADLFEGVRFCDLSDGGIAPQAVRERLQRLLVERPSVPTVLFISEKVGRIPQEISAGVLSVREPSVTPATFARILGFFEGQGDSASGKDLVAQPAVTNYFRRWVEQNEPVTLQELRNEYVRGVLLFRDPESGQFSPPLDGETADEGPSYIVRSLNELLENEGKNDTAALLQALARKRHRGWSDADLTSNLFQATRTICESRLRKQEGSGPRRFSSKMSTRSLWLWSALLLVWADRRATEQGIEDPADAKDLFVGVDQLLHRFCQISLIIQSDPLSSYWEEFANAMRALSVGDENTEDQRHQLFRQLRRLTEIRLEPSWIQKLRRLAANAGAVPDDSETVNNSSAAPNAAPASFAEIVGQGGAIRHLRARFTNNDHSRALAIIGPPGSGKMTLARLYAKSLLCEGVRIEGGSACGLCSSCVTFDSAPAFGYIQIDLGHPDALAHARDHINHLRSSSFSAHRVIILTAPEAFPEGLDAFLKSFEEEADETTFVVLSADEGALSLAARSRVEIIRTQKLNRAETRQLVDRWLPQKVKGWAFDLIYLVGGGLPGPMAQAAMTINNEAVRTVKEARTVLDVGWGEVALGYWELLLSNNCSDRTISDIWGFVEPKVALHRVRVILSGLRDGRCSQVPALLGLEERCDRVSQLLDRRAAKMGISRNDLCVELMQHWMKDGILDAESFEEAHTNVIRVLKA